MILTLIKKIVPDSLIAKMSAEDIQFLLEMRETLSVEMTPELATALLDAHRRSIER